MPKTNFKFNKNHNSLTTRLLRCRTMPSRASSFFSPVHSSLLFRRHSRDTRENTVDYDARALINNGRATLYMALPTLTQCKSYYVAMEERAETAVAQSYDPLDI